MGRRRKGEPKPICPRCGRPYSYIERKVVNGKTYYYAVHYVIKGGKRTKERCYLGPEYYDYVTKTHTREGLVLEGLVRDDRVISYLTSLITAIQEPSFHLSKELALKFADRLELLAKRLREYGESKEG